MGLSYHSRGRPTPGDSIDTALVYDVPAGTDPESIRAAPWAVLGRRNRRPISGLAT
jgi:hypothetical protein